MEKENKMIQRDSITEKWSPAEDCQENSITKIFNTRVLTGSVKTFQTGGRTMRSLKFLTMIAAIAFLATACVSDGQNTQRGAVLGGILGAVAGQAIGHNTAGTLIGAGAGALTGAVIGNTHDQQVMEWRMQDRYPDYPERPYGTYYGPESPYGPQTPYATEKPYAALPPEGYRSSPQGHYPEPPAGHWVNVPGQWANGKWVPSHKIWVPVNPGNPYRR
jgi:hypothetical protein